MQSSPILVNKQVIRDNSSEQLVHNPEQFVVNPWHFKKYQNIQKFEMNP